MGRTLFFFSLLVVTGLQALEAGSLADAQAEFGKADGRLNAAWGEAKKQLSGEALEELKMRQRAWVVYRDERAEVAGTEGKADGADPKKSPAYFLTAAQLSDDRAGWLLRLAKGDAEPLTGVWIDGSGGTLEIVEQDGRLLFDFSVVRTQAFNLGNLAGIATWNDPLGWFSDKGRDVDKPDETNVVFIRKPSSLEIVTANADYYHGNRAYFDGSYFKVASLNAGEQAAVVKAGETGKPSAEQ